MRLSLSIKRLIATVSFTLGHALALCGGEEPSANPWTRTWEADANGSRLVMENDVVDHQLRGAIRDATGYTYLIEAELTEEQATGTFSDPQTGTLLEARMRITGESLVLTVMPPKGSALPPHPILQLEFAPKGTLPEKATSAPVPGQLDPSIVGTWIRTESSSDSSSGFSYVVQWTLRLNRDGSFQQTSQSAGGSPGITGGTSPQIIAQGSWKAENKFLWIDTGSGFQPFVRYLVDPHHMMFVFQDDTRQLWSRSP